MTQKSNTVFDPDAYVVRKKQSLEIDSTETRYTEWSDQKIKNAIMAASQHAAQVDFDEHQLSEVMANVHHAVMNETLPVNENSKFIISVDLIHNIVINSLKAHYGIQKAYSTYRNYKVNQRKSYRELYEDTDKLSNGTYTENANKDSAVISTKRSLLAEMTTKQLMRDFILPPEWLEAHNQGWIYIHDLGDLYWRTFNCDNVDIARIMRNKQYEDGEYAFKLNGVKYTEPKGITSALNLFGDITLAASSQQFGGFSTQNVDYIFAPYAEKTYKSKLEHYKEKGLTDELAKDLAEGDTLSAIEQGIQGYEFKTSTVSNALGQIPFTSIGFGLDVSKWGRAITRAILTERSKPESTFVFPKLIFASSKDINLEPGTPNYDLFQKAVECSSRKLYPDYVSMDEGILAPAFKRHKDDPSQYLSVPMGCRSYNANVFINPVESDENFGKEVYVGRGNVGVVTLNLAKMAIESKGSWLTFDMYLQKYTEMVCDILNWRYNYAGEAYAESNPLMWVAGGAWTQLKPSDRVAKAIHSFSASIGVIGMNEALNAMYLNGYRKSYTVETLPGFEAGGIRQKDQKRILKIINTLKEELNKKHAVRITTEGDVEPVYKKALGTFNYIPSDPNKDYILVFEDIKKQRVTEVIPRGYSIYGTPAESLVYNFMKMLQKQYGLIPAVTAKADGSKRNYLTNSWHVPVWEDISAFDKIDYEAQFHLDGMASGGHIGYTEHPYGTSTSVIEQLIRYAMEKGMYYGINMASSTCFACHWVGETADVCPECGSENVVTIQRTCGYLTITSRNGKSVSNLGKQEEYLERVNHTSTGSTLTDDTKKDYTKHFEKTHSVEDLINKDFSLFE